MEDGIERSISIILNTIQRVNPTENSNDKKKDAVPIETDDKKEKKD
jgi:hypothetical protein